MKLAILSGALLLALVPGTAHAFGNADAKMLFHLASTTSSQVCTRTAASPACDDIDTSGGLYPNVYFAYLLVADGSATEGVGGILAGIDYGSGPTDGVGLDIFSWTICATIELAGNSPPWYQTGSANLISWDTGTRCQRNEPGGPGTGVVATAGYFYCTAYGPATLQIAPHRRRAEHPDELIVANCANQNDLITDPDNMGSVVFSASGTEEGHNPCLKVVAVQGTTWSRIKSGIADE
jgi:hypothetical protein